MAKKKYPDPFKDDEGSEETRTSKTKEMTETELLAIVDNAIQNSLGKMDTKLSNDRLTAMKYYLGDKTGNLAPPEAEGRSSVVSMDVADTIEWILPTLIRMFTSGDEAVEYTARKESEVPFAEQATMWANYVFYTQNPGFIIIHDLFKDALLQKFGVIKTWWDDSDDITTEEYEGLTLEELTLMLEDGTVKVLQKTERTIEPPEGIEMGFQQAQTAQQAQMAHQPPPQPGQPPLPAPPPLQPPPATTVYDIKIKRTADASHICIENVPPEEFLFSRKARSADRIFNCHHRIERSVTELKEAGYKNTDTLDGDDSDAEFSQEAVERDSDTNEFTYGNSLGDSSDKTMRMVWITESYMQVDWNGDGLAEWRKIVKSGKTLMANDEIDEHPFSMITPIKMPHKLVGRSIADLVMDLQDIKTALRRQIIDNMYLRNNPRNYVDTTKGVNIDDLLDSRVGGIVRGKGENGVTPMVVQDLSPLTFQLLEDLDRTKQERTGVSPQSQGIDVNAINKTATESNNLVSSAMSRIELIARVFAETGVKDLFKKILKLSGQYQKQAQVVRLTGNKFVNIDPRAWKTQYDITINVGLGNGNKDQMAQRVMGIMQVQKDAAMNGLPIVGPKQIYNAAKKLVINSGFKNADAFFVDPDSDEGKQMAQQHGSKPDPEMQKMQAQMQMNQAELQMKQQSDAAQNAVQKANDDRDFQRQQANDQADLQMRMTEMKMQNDLKVQEMQLNAQLKREEMAQKFEMERQHKLMDAELDLHKQASGQQHESTLRNTQPEHESNAMNTMAGMASASMQSFAQIAQALTESANAPKEITIGKNKSGGMVGKITKTKK